MSQIITYVENHAGLFTALAAIVTILGVVGKWIIAYYRGLRPEEHGKMARKVGHDQTPRRPNNGLIVGLFVAGGVLLLGAVLLIIVLVNQSGSNNGGWGNPQAK